MKLRLVVLGCGPSPGVPRITGDWGACDPQEPRNRRTRCAALFERLDGSGATRVAVDCGPDFRNQMLAHGVPRLDAVVLTHAHADHIHGLDDLRGFYFAQRERIPVYADARAFKRVHEAFAYCFETPPGSSYPPIARHVPITPFEPVAIDGPGGELVLTPIEQHHGSITSIGWRCGPIAYCPDVSGFSERAQVHLRELDHIVIGALQHQPHPSHLTVADAVDWVDRLGAKAGTLTHMNIPLDYRALCKELPPYVRPGHDGLTLEFELKA